MDFGILEECYGLMYVLCLGQQVVLLLSGIELLNRQPSLRALTEYHSN